MKPFTIFADYAGHLEDPDDQAISLVTLIASEEQVKKGYSQLEELRKWVYGWGINTKAPEFEFHAYEIFQGSDIWRNIGGNENVSASIRMKVLKKLKAIIETANLPYAVIVIDKREAGFMKHGLERFSHDVKDAKKKIMDVWSETEEQKMWEAQIPNETKGKGFGKVENLIWLLFGYTNALMHEIGYLGESEIIADKQFVKQIGGINLVLHMLETDLPERLFIQSGIQLSVPTSHRRWQIKSFSEADSANVWGIQLADYIAYTIKRRQQDKTDNLIKLSEIKGSSLIPLPKSIPAYEGAIYKGIYVNYYPYATNTGIKFWNKLHNRFR